MMPTFVIEITREAILTTLLVAGPLLLSALVVGLAISLLQAVTQIQEQTLNFVPKAFCMAAVLVLLMPWYIRTLTRFMVRMIESTASVAG